MPDLTRHLPTLASGTGNTYLHINCPLCLACISTRCKQGLAQAWQLPSASADSCCTPASELSSVFLFCFSQCKRCAALAAPPRSLRRARHCAALRCGVASRSHCAHSATPGTALRCARCAVVSMHTALLRSLRHARADACDAGLAVLVGPRAVVKHTNCVCCVCVCVSCLVCVSGCVLSVFIELA